MGEITVTRSIITLYDVNDIVIYREIDSALRTTIGIGKVIYYSYNQGRDTIEYHIVGNLVKDLEHTNNTLHTNIVDEDNILGKVNFDSYKTLMDYNPDDKNSKAVSSKYEIGDIVSYFTTPSHKLIPDEPIDAHSSFGEIINKYSNEDGTFYYDIKDKKKPDCIATVLEDDIIGTVIAF